ncbi:protein translocase SEC61 complex subunit gamma [Promethearchaeum syntrophicum]|uniref:Protein translocase subunit SecE n=1 Tax=Promethearchaeum syntrophicum TaxID=2594042 RepID=A0A5B9DF93_9ARCH|nr:protein translocase SEC61 complex subunit gamma [Candidatus Prometheoarchaeum syntrophicum]QEE17453.1 preprotein translocase subunit SecE [Candidatus Prometheoarchaeum syntrophicum]
MSAVTKDAPSQSMNKLQKFFLNSRRILKISVKPTRKMYGSILKVCLIGLAVIGALSYIIQLISQIIQNAAQ